MNSIAPATVALRVDASLDIGTGHVMRCLTLADALRAAGADCRFLCREHPGNLITLIRDRGFPVSVLGAVDEGARILPADDHAPPDAGWLGCDWRKDASQTQQALASWRPDWLVLDHYALDSRWEIELQGCYEHLLVIDDLADRTHQADVLLDQNLGRLAEDYRDLVPGHCRHLIGPRYALLRPEFAEWRKWSLERRQKGGPVKRLLVSLGGVDKDNVTGQLLDALYEINLPESMEITVVMGASAPWLEEVRERARRMLRDTEVVLNVNDMARRMGEADLAIGAAGSTTWERCCLGLPTIVLVLAENQKEIAQVLHAEGAAHALLATDAMAELVHQWSTITQRDYLDRLSRRAAGLVDGRGGDRVRKVLMEAEISEQVTDG
jgi:UDP-2,4-diacetamido-2,4,6-trideoxy-beta-L-altropyranose hydrolase